MKKVKKNAGGFMDVIRCDEPSYLIWKWHPAGSQSGENRRENAIRWGSSLRVRDGSVAVFVYNQKNGTYQDFIEGPYDEIIKTSNFPVLASIVGLAYSGDTPFQAEVYFINLAKVIQIPFAVPFFDLFDPRFLDFSVPVAVRGTITFNISDYREFIKLHRLDTFNLDTFQTQVRDAISKYVKGVVTNVPIERGIPLIQIERETLAINEIVEKNISERFHRDFGVNVSAVDIKTIEINKESAGYKQLKAVTQDVATATIEAQTAANIKNIEEMQRINMENLQESLRIQREEGQYAMHKQTQSDNLSAFQLEKQAEVGIAGAAAFGQMNSNGASNMSGGNFNPAGIITGLAMGGVIGKNMAGMMNGMIKNVAQPVAPPVAPAAPPPIPSVTYHVAVNGQSTGPYDMETLTQMASSGDLTRTSLVWKAGMPDWTQAGTVQELQRLFDNIPPAPPVK